MIRTTAAWLALLWCARLGDGLLRGPMRRGGRGALGWKRGALQTPGDELYDAAGVTPGPNVDLDMVKNVRDLASVEGSGIQPHRFIRMGYPSKATDEDCKVLLEELGIRTLIDVRSDKELYTDELVGTGSIYGHFTPFRRCRKSNAWFKFEEGTLPEDPLSSEKPPFHKKMPAMVKKWKAARPKPVPTSDPTAHASLGRERLLMSIIDESTYKVGVFAKLRKRHKAALLLLLAGGLFSRRVYQRARNIVLEYVNEGGLPLLNQLLLHYSGEDIARVLRICADDSRYPIGLYCTAGKDRTGLISMLILAALGTPDEAILDDYVLSDSAYKDLNDHKAMVGALEQQNLDAETFLRAPRHVMEQTLKELRESYGTVEQYLDSIGFDAAWRAKLKHALRTA